MAKAPRTVSSAAGNMAVVGRHAPKGGKMRLHTTEITHHTNGSHTLRHRFAPNGAPAYMGGDKEQSSAHANAGSMLKALKAKLMPSGEGPAMAPDTDNDQM